MPLACTCLRTSPSTHTPGRIHRHNRRHALRRSEPQHRHRARLRDRIAIQRDDLKTVPRQRNPVHLRRAGVQHVQHHALALLHPHRLAEAQHLAVDGRHLVVGHRGAVGARASSRPPQSCSARKISRSYAGRAAAVARLDHQKSMLPAVLPLTQIVARKGVRVEPAEAGRVGREGDRASTPRARSSASLPPSRRRRPPAETDRASARSRGRPNGYGCRPSPRGPASCAAAAPAPGRYTRWSESGASAMLPARTEQCPA